MKLPLLAALSIAFITAYAVPAKMGITIDMPQPDGSSVRLSLCGDEHRHLYLTDDGISVIGTSDGYFYATLDAEGIPVKSDALAHNPTDRGASEASLLSDIDQEAIRYAMRHAPSRPKQITHSGIGSYANDYPTLGQNRGLVLLVQYADVPFTLSDPYTYFNDMLNQPGFSDYNATGSARDYFIDNSHGLYLPDFDVYGPVTLPNPRQYYGSNNASGSDKYPHYMMLHAARLLDDTVDFSRYDLDGDGYVDNVFIFYAGEGEATGGGADTVWPHSWSYRFDEYFDGVRFRNYACSSELISSWMPDGIGTFCHEFCHVLGLPDLYNTDDAYSYCTPLFWSLMDQGCYNNDGRTPAAMSAFERNALGWMDDHISEPDHPGSYTLEALAKGGEALLLPTRSETEFFVIENRQLTGWDTYLPHHGMLVWHIDYDKSKWKYNIPNNDENHQHVDIVEACGRTYSTKSGAKRYTFPGPNNVTELRYGGKPSLEDWQGNDIGYVITDITEANGLITFGLSGESGITDVSEAPHSWSIDGRRICAHGSHVTVRDISGRMVASGSSVDTVLAAPGLYIISIDGTPYKVMAD